MTELPVVVGHRGWPSRFPDNTLAGFLAASAIADAIELDVRRSADGKLVLSHDPTLVGLVVSETAWSVLAELDLGNGHKPALLDEALAALPDTPVQLEVKNVPDQPGFEPDHRLALEAAERARPGDTVSSFNHVSLEVVRRVFPDVPTGLAIERFCPLDECVNYCLDAGHSVLVPEETMIEKSIASTILAELRVFPWTVNDPDRARELVGFGVSGIITDDPGLISQHLKGNP
ncbi:MAG: glycerophosphodiester phosphodiesterase [Acidobacteria bacterium]|nr:MAG: glycerophosphodiester phosphodiesterase [Acidobacteriota bacterium]